MSRQKLLWYSAAVSASIGLCCIIASGMRFSGVLCWSAALLLIAFSVLDRLSARHRWARWSARVFATLSCVFLLLFLLFEIQIVLGARSNSDDRDVSCVLVLGAGVDGTEPSLILRQRLDAALAFVSDKDVPIIVSGCQGKGEDISEAECMARYLASHGIGSERIQKEEQASSTRTNFQYSLALMHDLGLDDTRPFVCVTSDFHIARSRYIAERLGVPQGGMSCLGAALPSGAYYTALTVNYYIREAFALANEMLMGVDLDL